MSAPPAQIAREVLTRRYQELYADKLTEFHTEYTNESPSPSWVWIDADLVPVNDGNNVAAVLLDPDIGVCLYLLPFLPDRGVRSQLSHALRIRSTLLPDRTPDQIESDPDGAWRVLVHWFVESEDFDQWLHEVGVLRGETAYFEEIPIDAIVNRYGDWDKTCTLFGFPRLLLKTRYILKKQSQEEVENWSSADALVTKTIKHLPEQFESGPIRNCAVEVVEQFARLVEQRTDEAADCDHKDPKRLNELQIHYFRNVSELSFTFGESEGVGAWLIHGANGTGKSSIYEALSFALCGTSYRYDQYREDRNEPAKDKLEKYTTQYLRPFGESSRPSRIVLNGKDSHIDELAIDVESRQALRALSGTMLSQEQSAEFVRISDIDLGAQIVGEASFLANEILSYVDDRYETARNDQKAFFDRWGLNKNIKNVETARRRIAERFVADRLSGPEALIAWLGRPELKMGTVIHEIDALLRIWDQWRRKRDELIKGLSKQRQEDKLANSLLEVAAAGNQAARKTESFLKRLRSLTADWDFQLEAHIRSWGEWLETQSQRRKTDSLEVKEHREKQQALQEKQQEIASEGGRLRARSDHLKTVQGFLEQSQWGATRGDECPTCATDLKERGGLHSVINDVETETNEKIEQYRRSHLGVVDELKNIEQRLAELGAAPPPIAADRQAEIVQVTQWLLPSKHSDLRKTISVPESREQLCTAISHLRQMPSGILVQSDDSLESVADEMANDLKEAFSQIEIASSEENAWRRIQNTLIGLLSTLVEEHLPETLQALWIELALNLTPARWQLPGQLAFSVDTKRSQPIVNVSLDVGDGDLRFARYVLNESEVHILGLAWFFVRYLTGGRFQFNFLVMDDPAQEMDQPTYRDLCRLWETFLRIHKREAIPFKLLVLLHQDERALDAARATGGTLHFLRWNAGKTELLRSTKLLGESYTPPYPLVTSSA